MPIDRPDGRHWCAPDEATPLADGTWTCPGCSKVWRLNDWDHVIREAGEPAPEQPVPELEEASD